jgi:YcaO-like protein with predicted kinase domain
LSRAGVSYFVFDISTDISVPVFSCVLISETEPSPGIFAGYGCSLDVSIALRRAITEAAQARACYISGARDDLFRRKFLAMKQIDTQGMLRLYNSLPTVTHFSSYPERSFPDIETEWKQLSSIIAGKGLMDLYYKVLYISDEPGFVIVRCVCPSMAMAPWESWSPNSRCREAVQSTIDAMKSAPASKAGGLLPKIL